MIAIDSSIRISEQKFSHMLAYQSGTHGKSTAQKAIDGILDQDTGDQYYSSVCSYVLKPPDDDSPATWWLDLKAPYTVFDVTVHNTFNRESKRGSNDFWSLFGVGLGVTI